MTDTKSYGRPVPPSRRAPQVIDLTTDELPCPWCGQPTEETDARCRGCGHSFG